jgi:protein SMG6
MRSPPRRDARERGERAGPDARGISGAPQQASGSRQAPEPHGRTASASRPHAHANATSPGKRALPMASPLQPSVVVHQAPQPDADEFARLRLGPGEPSRPLRGQPSRHQLYDHRARDDAPERALSDHSPGPARSASRFARGDVAAGPRQLFDPRKDDPVRFQVLARSGGGGGGGSSAAVSPGARHKAPSHADWISAGSSSSYAQSAASSSFTLSSTTDGSSASGASGPGRTTRTDDTGKSGSSAFSEQLKRLYRGITALEEKLVREDAVDSNEDVRVVLRGQEAPVDEDAQIERWKKTIADHKRFADRRLPVTCL